ncbi:hypothetical protein VR46_28845, partial [Streptomyces sp. NRRL S-444]
MASEYAEVVDVLQHDGCLRPAGAALDSERAARVAGTTVLITGAPELTAPLVHALSTTGYAHVGPAPEDLSVVDVRDTVLVAAFSHPAHRELSRIDELCARSGLRWLPLRHERGRAVLGPAITPGTTADFADVLD